MIVFQTDCWSAIEWYLFHRRIGFLVIIFAAGIVWILRKIQRWYQIQKRYWICLDKIPGPPALPIVGNTIALNVDHGELYQRLIGMRMLWGCHDGINKAWLGPNPYIFVSKASTVEKILSSNRHIDKSFDYNFLRPWLGTGLLTSNGSKWRQRRKILTPTFHFTILEDFIEVFGEQTAILVKQLESELHNESFNISPYVTHCTLDIICETAMGRQVSAQNNSDSEYVRAVYEIGNIIQTRQASIWYHPDSLFRITPLYKKHQECIRVLHAFSSKVISERKGEILNNTENNNIDEVNGMKKKRLAFLDMLIEASENGTILSNEDIREEVDTFMFEGHDTTSSAICWTLYLLGCHPEYQERVVEELDQVYGEGDYHRRPTLKDLKSMRYLERCIKEALRLYPSVPLLARRIAEDVQIGSYTIPEGTTAVVIVPMLHRNPEVFSNPEKFDPDRFSPENSKGRHPYAFIPFSAGPRNCIGQKFALLEEKAVISGVLRKFRIESAERREDVSITAELVIRAKNGLNVRIKPRL